MVTGLTIGGKPVLGSFGKGLPGSITLNFSTSGGNNCDRGCRYHPDSTHALAAPTVARCYAATCENRHDRTQLRAKLERHEATDASVLITLAMSELDRKGWDAPWFRFSAFGSVPMEVPDNFADLILQLRAHGVPIHLPIETAEKAERYRHALVGTGVAVRESATDMLRWETVATPMSMVAGSMEDKPAKRIRDAKELAALRAAGTGRKVIVCPAVAAMHLRTKSDKAKCGACTACANPNLDVVYPVHK